ncbi:DUF3983 domain-containing protein [Bacillus sp. JJ1773]
MANKQKQKRRLKKAITQRKKELEKEKFERLDRAWRNIFVKNGVLKG